MDSHVNPFHLKHTQVALSMVVDTSNPNIQEAKVGRSRVQRQAWTTWWDSVSKTMGEKKYTQVHLVFFPNLICCWMLTVFTIKESYEYVLCSLCQLLNIIF
jgi:hypothetical protein